VRLFFALLLPDEAREVLRASHEIARRCGLSVGKFEQLHFTMAFLGEQPSAKAALLAGEVLTEAARFQVTIAGAVAFPSKAHPRVVALGVTRGAEELTALAERLRTSLRGAGLAVEERRFHPHLTLGRAKPGANARRAVTELPTAELATFEVRAIHLMQSQLGSGGAHHVVLQPFELR
jgi:2'-5' RNA ligase